MISKCIHLSLSTSKIYFKENANLFQTELKLLNDRSIRHEYLVIYNQKSIKLEIRTKSLQKKKFDYEMEILKLTKNHLATNYQQSNLIYSNIDQDIKAIDMLNRLIPNYQSNFINDKIINTTVNNNTQAIRFIKTNQILKNVHKIITEFRSYYFNEFKLKRTLFSILLLIMTAYVFIIFFFNLCLAIKPRQSNPQTDWFCRYFDELWLFIVTFLDNF